MGNGITQVFAQAGFDVVMRDVGQAPIDRGMAAIKKSLAKYVEKSRITSEESDASLRTDSHYGRPL